MVAEVLVEIKAKQIDKTFTYIIPLQFVNQIKAGVRVYVPFGRQKLEGFVLKISNKETYDYELKEIIDIIDIEPVLNQEMIELGKVISNKTLSTLMSAYQCMLPKALKAKNNFQVNKKYQTYLEITNEKVISPLTLKQTELLNIIKVKKITKKEAKTISLCALKKLLELNLVKEVKEEIYRIDNTKIFSDKKIILNEEQTIAVNEVKNNLNKYTPYLLFGVTGSGKTEVYMHIIAEVLNENKEVIVLVPEISLTPQLVDTFKARFGDIAILHSRLSDGEKYDEWRRILKKEVNIVVGARSAIFAPFTNLGLIIIDEEHSITYKQDNNPRYNAIDIALFRAKKYNIPVVMGSATPSIESYTRALLKNYKLLTLKNRVNKNMPTIDLIDMKESIKKGNRLLSKELYNKIIDRLNKNEQIILLLNRRGYSTVITCQDCGYVDKCPNCDIPLTYHKSSNTMRCHYCGFGSQLLLNCPNCNSKNINQFGIGTQKLEEEIKKNFINSKVIRMDYDTTTTKNSHERIITAFRNNEYNILIGTQMISKGLDFPNVTLVGVLNGDASLNIPDFRSAERTYQLLDQVAGRSGRGLKHGEVVIQSFNIDHYSIVKASRNDYVGFYNEEILIRKKLKYPPFYNLILIKIQGANYDDILNEANKIRKYLELHIKYSILGPSSANILKINNIYHIQIIIKYKKANEIIEYIEYIYNKYKTNKKIIVDVDFNPIKI
ncbi:MAG: primosomal protein N' [Bacilli bacterium]